MPLRAGASLWLGKLNFFENEKENMPGFWKHFEILRETPGTAQLHHPLIWYTEFWFDQRNCKSLAIPPIFAAQILIQH